MDVYGVSDLYGTPLVWAACCDGCDVFATSSVAANVMIIFRVSANEIVDTRVLHEQTFALVLLRDAEDLRVAGINDHNIFSFSLKDNVKRVHCGTLRGMQSITYGATSRDDCMAIWGASGLWQTDGIASVPRNVCPGCEVLAATFTAWDGTLIHVHRTSPEDATACLLVDGQYVASVSRLTVQIVARRTPQGMAVYALAPEALARVDVQRVAAEQLCAATGQPWAAEQVVVECDACGGVRCMALDAATDQLWVASDGLFVFDLRADTQPSRVANVNFFGRIPINIAVGQEHVAVVLMDGTVVIAAKHAIAL